MVKSNSYSACLARYRAAGLAGLTDRSRRPRSRPNQASPELEARMCERRRDHPRWGAQRILHELMRGPVVSEPMPSRATVHAVLRDRQGRRARDRPRDVWRSLRRSGAYGAPEEVLTDNSTQFTDRFRRGGEVLFDRICRRDGIAHRLTRAELADDDREDRAVPLDAAQGAAR